MKNTKQTICIFCVLMGNFIPWILLSAGAILSVGNFSDGMNETAAWLTAFALVILTISFFMHRLAPRR